MKQTLTDEQYKIKVIGEAHNMLQREMEKKVHDNKEWMKVLEELNIPHYVG